MYKFLVVKGCAGGFCEKLSDVFMCLAELMPAGSKTDLLLAMAGPVSNSGRDFGITELEKGRKSGTTEDNQRSEGVSQTTLQISTEAGRGAVPGTRTDSPAVHGGPHNRAGGCLKEVLTQWKAHAVAVFSLLCPAE